MDAQIKYITFAIDQFDGFLLFALDINFLESSETSDAMIYMCDVIANFEIRKFL